MAGEKQRNGHRRVAIVQGLRTPFVKAGSDFAKLTALDLGRMVSRSWCSARRSIPR